MALFQGLDIIEWAETDFVHLLWLLFPLIFLVFDFFLSNFKDFGDIFAQDGVQRLDALFRDDPAGFHDNIVSVRIRVVGIPDNHAFGANDAVVLLLFFQLSFHDNVGLLGLAGAFIDDNIARFIVIEFEMVDQFRNLTDMQAVEIFVALQIVFHVVFDDAFKSLIT